jgi:hypothetical protein
VDPDIDFTGELTQKRNMFPGSPELDWYISVARFLRLPTWPIDEQPAVGQLPMNAQKGMQGGAHILKWPGIPVTPKGYAASLGKDARYLSRRWKGRNSIGDYPYLSAEAVFLPKVILHIRRYSDDMLKPR